MQAKKILKTALAGMALSGVAATVSSPAVLAVVAHQKAAATPAKASQTATPKQSSTTKSGLVEAALDLIRGGSIDMGIDELRKLGEQGHADAFYHLAEINRIGLDAKHPASIPIATMYYRLAAGLGHKQAALNLANLLFFEADHTQANVDEAMKLWQKYALKDDPESLYLLGMTYWNGEGNRLPDPIRGYGLMWLAATKGYTDAVKARDMMQSQLSDEAQTRGRQYATALDTEGFSDKPIDLYMVMGRDGKKAPENRTQVAAVMPAGAQDITAETPGGDSQSGVPADSSGGQREKNIPVKQVADASVTTGRPVATDAQPVVHSSAAPASTSDEASVPGPSRAEPEKPAAEVQATDTNQPVDWQSVWRLEIGVPLRREEVNKLQKVIEVAHADIVQGLRSEVVESVNSPGLYRLVFGPVDGMQGAVRRCIGLKRAGFDCFARPPE